MKVEVNPSEQQLYEGVGIAYDMSTYVRFDKYGLYGIKNKSDFVAESPDDIEDNASFGITWKGFFIKNSYTNGYVSITEDDDFKVVKVINGDEVNKIKIGVLEFDTSGNPTLYGISVKNDNDLEVFKTDDNGNIVANNITIRGSIKASVFEYEEIQAIGGIIVVRPSTAIKDVVGYIYNGETITGLKVLVENPTIFENNNHYCRFGVDSGVYNVTKDVDNVVTIEGFTDDNYPFEEIIGAALVSLAEITESGGVLTVTDNYGIAINSADSNVQFPSQTISLFETEATRSLSNNILVNFNYRGILGTLPSSTDCNLDVSQLYTTYITGKQGIYTDNIYIGDANQYMAFYKDEYNNGHLTVKGTIDASSLVINPDGSSKVSYTVTISVDSIDYVNNKAVLVATPHYQGLDVPNNVNLIYSWYEDDLSSQIEYMKTFDTTIIQGKTYYIYDDVNDEYDEVVSPLADELKYYFEEANGDTLNVTNLEKVYICVISIDEES